ncbi:MAG TPA: ATP-binding protein [Methylophilaceae bacterium]|nr:ATP-binding protein [Methylophilaceae bacterium]
MRGIDELRIRTKLIVITVLTCTIALFLAGIIIVAYDNHVYHSQKVGELTAQAKILAAGMSAPLEFDDVRAAKEYLAPLSANQDIFSGAVYRHDGSLFASYTRPHTRRPPDNAQPHGIQQERSELSIFWPVLERERPVGSVFLLAKIEPLSERIFRYSGIFLLAMILSLAITLPIAMRLHYAIANPIYARSLIEASIDPLVTINTAGEITDVNVATLHVTGKTRDELIGTDFAIYFTEPDKAREIYKQVFEQGAVTDFPLTIRHVEGKQVDVLYNASLYKNESDAVVGVVATARDVTLQRQAEIEINRRTAELQVANHELEAFSYSVSHDLRAPLRSIDGFSLALLEDYADKLDDQGKNYLNRVRAATQRMGALIDDMLELSRIARVEMRHSYVDLSVMANEVLQELSKNDEARVVKFEVQENLLAEGDSKLLRIVLDNLIGNAWKYTSKIEEAHIEFGSVPDSENIINYYVRDNGAGFDMVYADKLFSAFQRLHTHSEFPGTGVGLATVQRIIHRHGGKIYGEGKPNQGATFFFTLTKPKIRGETS